MNVGGGGGGGIDPTLEKRSCGMCTSIIDARVCAQLGDGLVGRERGREDVQRGAHADPGEGPQADRRAARGADDPAPASSAPRSDRADAGSLSLPRLFKQFFFLK